jgi:hypothetical protein
MSPKAEQYLKEELWSCFKYIKIPFDVLYKMPTRDRKFFIERHNASANAENNDSENNGGVSYEDFEESLG